MKKLLVSIISFTIILGVLALSFNAAFGNKTITYLEKIRVDMANGGNFYYWKFNYWGYLKNLELTTSDYSKLVFEIPTRQFENITLDNYWAAIGNDLALILDYIIMVINILLYPLRLGAYLIRNIIAIFGINNDTTDPQNGMAWLITFVKDILERIAIPYI